VENLVALIHKPINRAYRRICNIDGNSGRLLVGSIKTRTTKDCQTFIRNSAVELEFLLGRRKSRHDGLSVHTTFDIRCGAKLRL
jgi:hypothetical protein